MEDQNVHYKEEIFDHTPSNSDQSMTIDDSQTFEDEYKNCCLTQKEKNDVIIYFDQNKDKKYSS